MKGFSYFAPTEIMFGCGVLERLGEITALYGKRAMLVSGPAQGAIASVYERAKNSLERAGVRSVHFDGVIPNPTTVIVSAGAGVAREFGADVVIGIGGGSSLDTAKAIAVEAVHAGTAWDYLHYTSGPTEKTLPVIAVGTTAGTGSQTTPCAVITNPEKQDKSAIWNRNIFPQVALVDPETMVSMPASVTAQTGFDAFCHNFEAYLSVNSNPYVEIMAEDAIARIAEWLPKVIENGNDLEARMQMAWADTLGGLTNASAGVTLPHGLGMQVGGHCPHVTHGQALAAIYPEFTRYTAPSAVEKFARIGRILDVECGNCPDEEAAERCCQAIDRLLKQIGLWIGFADLEVTKSKLRVIADCGQILGDYRNNPKVATIEEMYDLLLNCYERQDV